MAVAKAEKDVSEGKSRLAAQGVLNRYPRIRTQTIGRNTVADRALRVMARAVVRTGGGIDGGARFPGSTDAERKENLNWALRVLHAFVNNNPADASAKAAKIAAQKNGLHAQQMLFVKNCSTMVQRIPAVG